MGAFEPLSTHLIKDVVHPGICMLRLLLVSEMINFILGDPEADGGGEGKSKRAEKYGTKKSKEFREELCAIFFRPFRLSLAPTICPWVSEDEEK